jgi:hypothetical protein
VKHKCPPLEKASTTLQLRVALALALVSLSSHGYLCPAFPYPGPEKSFWMSLPGVACLLWKTSGCGHHCWALHCPVPKKIPRHIHGKAKEPHRRGFLSGQIYVHNNKNDTPKSSEGLLRGPAFSAAWARTHHRILTAILCHCLFSPFFG